MRLNPVNILLSARSAGEVMRQLARWRRLSLHYGWKRDPNYQGSKGGKWVDEDNPKNVRYQPNEPGKGRQKQPGTSGKQPATRKPKGDVESAKAAVEQARAGKLSREELRDALSGLTGSQLDELKRHFKVRGGGSKKADKQAALEGHGTAAGEKPPAAPAGGHGELIGHLHDALGGDEEAFARLQDRIAGMSPEERASARQKLAAAMGGGEKRKAGPRQRAAAPRSKSTRSPVAESPAAPRQQKTRPVAQAAGELWPDIGAAAKVLQRIHDSRTIKIPELFDVLKERNPTLDRAEFDRVVLKLRDEGKIHLESVNPSIAAADDRAGEGIETDRGMQYFVTLNENPPESAKPARLVSESKTRDLWPAIAAAARDAAGGSGADYGGVVKVPELFDAVRRKVPGLDQKTFHRVLQQLHLDGKIHLEAANSPNAELRAGEGIRTGRGLLFYVHLMQEPPPS